MLTRNQSFVNRSKFASFLLNSIVAGKVSCPAIFCLCLSLAFAVAVAQAQPPPAQTDDGEEEVVRVSTELVQTDVMVFDRQGRFVEGLRPEQFELRVDGKAQTISFFDQIKAGQTDEGKKIAGARRGAAAQSRESSLGGRVVFFFVDDLHLQYDSVNRTREAILRFVNNDMQPGDQAAIFTASGQLGVLQQLTSEKAVLRAALKRLTTREYGVRDAERTTMTEAQAVAVENNDRATLDYFVQQLAKEMNQSVDRRRSIGRNRQTPAENQIEGMVRARARSILEQSRFITRNMLQTLENLLRSSNPIPTRKVFFLISDGFFITPNSDTQQQLKQITDAAARSGAVIYALEARGLTSGMPDAGERLAFDIVGDIPPADIKAVTGAQEPLRLIAQETGGRAMLDANKFGDVFKQVLNETSSYYVLAWQPADESAQKNADFRLIEASIKGRDDLIVRMRRGFFNESSDAAAAAAKNKRDKPKKSKEEKSPLMGALQALYPRRSLPVFVSAGFTDSAQTGLTLTASVQIDGQALEIAKAEKTDIDILGIIISDEGKEIANFEQSLTVDPARMTKAQQRSIVYTRQVPLKPGLYQIRVAAQENKRKRLGSSSFWIELPDVKQAGFSIGSLLVGEIAPDAAQAMISVNRRMLPASRFFFQTEIYNAAAPVDIGLEMQILRAGGQVVKTLPSRKLMTTGVADLTRIPYADDFPLNDLAPGAYVLQITATDRAAKKTVARQIDFVVE